MPEDEKVEFEIHFQINGETGMLICPDPTYMHVAVMGKLDPKIAEFNHKNNMGDWACG